jgi:hypothetical protein
MIEYYLPSVPAGPVIVEILDAKGTTVNSYNSETSAASGGRGGAGAGAPDDPDAPPSEGRAGRGGGPVPRLTKLAGLNRVVWDVRHQSGLPATPGSYQARLTVGDEALTQPFKVLIDPLLAEEGLTVADLQEQFDHNTRMRALVASVNQVVMRLREAQARLRGATGTDAEMAKRVDALAARLLTEPVRYGKPGLQAHISYLAGMTAGVDQKIGRDAIERYGVLRKELEAISAEVERALGR